MARALALAAAVLCSLAQAGDVARPQLLKHHRVYSANDQMFLQVRIVPNPSMRTVALEAWELERGEDESVQNGFESEWAIPSKPTRIGRVRYSREDVAPKQQTYGFTWRGLDAGNYELIAVVALAGGRTLQSTPSIILVR